MQQRREAEMQEQTVSTELGQIAVAIEGSDRELPLVFMHGIFLDRTLWAAYGSDLTARTHIYLDMPAHGQSSHVGRDWQLDECATLLIRVLDALEITDCIAIGHSWGSMTALRAAVSFPERFRALGLFNMPVQRPSGLRRLGFVLQKQLVRFPRFYARQAAKSLYSTATLRLRPEYALQMQNRLSQRPPQEIRRVIDAVLLQPTGAARLLQKLTVPALAVVGETDFVGQPPEIESIVVPGGHISPHEAVDETRAAIQKIAGLAIAAP
ncbi:MAG: alpha/beta hydrolase [Leptolyngbya sp. SIO4C1]|nr:alpha/beta hydrolase [Leptolyngbya sp. SIO4C1]